MWYKYSFPALACQGIDADCSRATDCANNYFVCDNCCRQQWFESKIITFKSDAVTRAEAVCLSFDIKLARYRRC